MNKENAIVKLDQQNFGCAEVLRKKTSLTQSSQVVENVGVNNC